MPATETAADWEARAATRGSSGSGGDGDRRWAPAGFFEARGQQQWSLRHGLFGISGVVGLGTVKNGAVEESSYWAGLCKEEITGGLNSCGHGWADFRERRRWRRRETVRTPVWVHGGRRRHDGLKRSIKDGEAGCWQRRRAWALGISDGGAEMSTGSGQQQQQAHI